MLLTAVLACAPAYVPAEDTEPVDTEPAGDTDTDTGGDTDTDTGGDTDTDTGGDTDSQREPSPPSLTSLDATQVDGRVQIGFRADDADGDLEGGVFVLTLNGQQRELRIPADLDHWAAGGTSWTSVPIGVCDRGTTYAIEGQVRDATGLASGLLADAVEVDAPGIRLSESPDDGSVASDLGTLTLPVTLCGRIDRATNDGSAYTGDVEYAAFRPRSSQYATFTLTWTPTGPDYNLYLFDMYGMTEESSVQSGGKQPEVVQAFVFAGEEYRLTVAGWSGSAGDFTLRIE